MCKCTIKDENEEHIYIGTGTYTFLIIDIDNKGTYEIIGSCTPYIYKDKKILYGWIYGDNMVDNLYHSIHLDDRCVIGCTKENILNIDEDWVIFGSIRGSQWNT